MALWFAEGSVVDADTDAIVNTVNCVGVMGKGIALQFKRAFPRNYDVYRAACDRHEVVPGKVLVFETGTLTRPRFILNFPTKRHWRGLSRLEDIEAGLDDVVAIIKERGIRSIAVPALGCGNGGLPWREVRPLIERKLAGLRSVDIHVYPPHGAPAADEQTVRTIRPRLTQSRAALIAVLQQYQTEGYKHSLLELQKLAYFLQCAGEKFGIRFVKGKFGPYSDKLNHLLQHLEGHFIRGYGDRSRSAEIFLMPGAAEEARCFLGHPSPPSVERVIALISGYETPYGMELLATTYWVMAESALAVVDEDFAIRAVQSWNARKLRIFKSEHVAKARLRLLKQNWFS